LTRFFLKLSLTPTLNGPFHSQIEELRDDLYAEEEKYLAATRKERKVMRPQMERMDSTLQERLHTFERKCSLRLEELSRPPSLQATSDPRSAMPLRIEPVVQDREWDEPRAGVRFEAPSPPRSSSTREKQHGARVAERALNKWQASPPTGKRPRKLQTTPTDSPRSPISSHESKRNRFLEAGEEEEDPLGVGGAPEPALSPPTGRQRSSSTRRASPNGSVRTPSLHRTRASTLSPESPALPEEMQAERVRFRSQTETTAGYGGGYAYHNTQEWEEFRLRAERAEERLEDLNHERPKLAGSSKAEVMAMAAELAGSEIEIAAALTVIRAELKSEKAARVRSKRETEERFLGLLCLLRTIGGSKERASSPGHMPEESSDAAELFQLCHEEVALIAEEAHREEERLLSLLHQSTRDAERLSEGLKARTGQNEFRASMDEAEEGLREQAALLEEALAAHRDCQAEVSHFRLREKDWREEVEAQKAIAERAVAQLEAQKQEHSAPLLPYMDV